MEHCLKSSAKSTKLREIGNKFYADKNFFDAILKYNESLCYAENGSDNMGLAYANRSAVYFEMKLYEKSLRNIELARANNYPEKNYEILKKRESKCQELMKNSLKTATDLSFFKLSYEPNKDYPSIANCLKLKSDKKYGRHIITNKALAVGDVIAIEEPVCTVLQEEFLYQRCSHCLKSNLLDLMPCSLCCQVMFCSNICLQNAYNSYHRFECPVSAIITTSFLNANMRMALRTFFCALAIFDDSLEKLMTFLTENNLNSILDCKAELNFKQKILAINSLIFDESIDVNVILFDELFQLNDKLKEMWISHRDEIITFLKKHTQIGSLNYHEIYGWPLKKGGLYDPEMENFKGTLAYRRGVSSFANGSYLFCSLVNHSCAPNVAKVFIDDKIIMIVQRPIKAGSQIFDNYGYSFTNIPREIRQMELQKHYRFTCNCEACSENFGLLPSLKVVDKIAFRHAKKSCQELAKMTQKQAKQRIKEISGIIQKNFDNFPSVEICSLAESFQACMEIMLKPEILIP
ncbi:hypothetical protein ACKWTF_013150 [Chironomus riparius]